jgi:predicted TIM-barrel fold metal-dependent hydrolase
MFVAVLAALVVGVLGAWLALPSAMRAFGGAWSEQPDRFRSEASAEAEALVDAALDGLDLERYVDCHVHALGLGVGGTGCWVNPNKLTWRQPWDRLQFELYAGAAGINDLDRADELYVERLLALVEHAGLGAGTHRLLAFDRHYLANGEKDDEQTEFYVPNDYALTLGERHPNAFAPTGSVHPYRADALQELQRLAERGVRWIKWLPAAMGIDPADARCDDYYDALVQHGMILLTHAGEEQAVHVPELQALGNPLRLRRALDRGVRVVMAHSASLGEAEDLDDPGAGQRACFDLFLRLMEEERYDGLLFGELSAVTQVNRMGVLRTLLERTDLHTRLVNGSDYPLPAVNAVIWTGKLAREGFLTTAERAGLNELYDYNPLLFDLVLKRTLRHPETGARFPASVFLAHPELE